jgi:hypothetical protein
MFSARDRVVVSHGSTAEFGECADYTVPGMAQQEAAVRLDRRAQHLVMREQGRPQVKSMGVVYGLSVILRLIVRRLGPPGRVPPVLVVSCGRLVIC